MASIADTFNRTDSATLGNSSDGQFTWSEISGDTDIVSNQAKSINANYAQAAFDLASDDHYAQAEFHTSNNIIICARLADAANQYLLQVLNSTTLRLFKKVATSFTQLGSNVSITFNTGEVYKISCDGSTIKGFQAGVERFSETDTALVDILRTGISAGVADAIWDNFEAADLAAGADPNRIRFPPQLSGVGVGGMLGGSRVN